MKRMIDEKEYNSLKNNINSLGQALEDEIRNREAEDEILNNAIGGTLRQLLSVKANIDFNNTISIDIGEQIIALLPDNTHTFIIYLSNLQSLKAGSKIVSTLYQDANGAVINDSSANMLVSSPNSGTLGIRFRNDTYTDATTFKNAMKGVLLAYEKA